MSLVVTRTDEGGVPVVSLAGEADLTTLPRLRDALARAATDHPGTTVVVDLDGLAVLDDDAIGGLVSGLSRACARGGDLVLVCSSPSLLAALARCRLDRVLAIHPTRSAALAGTVPHG